MKRRTFTSLALIAAAPGALSGCATLGPAVAAIPQIIDKAAAWLALIDSFVSSLMSNPAVPPEFRQQYELLKIDLHASVLAVRELISQGEEFYELAQARYKDTFLPLAERLLDLLKTFSFLDAQGNLKAPDNSVEGVQLPKLRQ